MRFVQCFCLVFVALTFTLGMAEAKPRSFGDSDPVEFGRKGPERYPVHGVDAARFQQKVNWRQAKRAGVAFAFIKATEGGDLLDPMFGVNWNGARTAGIPTGAYHFYYFCTKPRVQARWFIRNVPRKRGALPPVLDVEWNPFSPTCTTRPPPKEVRRVMTIWLNVVERHYGQRPIIYTTPDFYKTNELYHFRGEEFWLRSTARPVDDVYPGQAWTFWQYTGTGLVPGFEGEVDINAFRGTKRQWRVWLKSRTR
ncbi:glycoside hydrolase [Roseovarius faecimaris]|uniref:Glycoside hydrolase n=1 Tax=Roseovarius faecimaris TaxID=2494550 RepID=A0A6I6IW66_9RHOB|nr:glycoside hydrolase [Roseovarius faecimaris]